MMGREISMCFIVIATVIGNSASLRDNTRGSPHDLSGTGGRTSQTQTQILEAILKAMQNEIIKAGSSVGGVQNSKRSQVQGQTIGDTISTEAQEIGQTIEDTLSSGAQGVGQAMGTIKDTLGNGAEKAGQAIGTIKDTLGNGAGEAGKAIQTFENTISTEAKVAGNAIGQVEETIIYETKNATEVVDILVSGVGNSNPTDIVMELVKYAMEHGFPKAFDYFIQYLIKIINPAAQKYLDDKTFKIQDIVAALKDVNFKQILNDIKKLTTKEGLSSALNRVNGHTITCLWDTATICSKQVIKPAALVYCVGKHMLGKGYDCFPDVEKCTRKLRA